MERQARYLVISADGQHEIRPFTTTNAAALGLPDEVITEGGGMPYEAARALMVKWNREAVMMKTGKGYVLPRKDFELLPNN